jgi:hypothetical protein
LKEELGELQHSSKTCGRSNVVVPLLFNGKKFRSTDRLKQSLLNLLLMESNNFDQSSVLNFRLAPVFLSKKKSTLILGKN